MKILLIEDDKVLIEEIQSYFSAEGYGSDVVLSAPAALLAIATHHYDIITFNISSLNKAEMDLLRFLKNFRLTERTILTYLPDRNVTANKIESLGMVSLSKPYSPQLLQALLLSTFRFEQRESEAKLFYNELMIDVPGRAVKVKDLHLNLTRREFDLLHLFVTNSTKVLSKTNLAQLIAKNEQDAHSDYGFLYAHIKNLKKKLKSAGCQDYIKTVYGIGYRFHVS